MLAGLLLGCCLTLPAQYQYSVNPDNTVSITGYNGGAIANIPTKLNGLSVSSIAEGAFSYQHQLTSLAVPDTVTNINFFAFLGCDGLTNVTLGSNVASIGVLAFANCSRLQNIQLPQGLTTLGSAAFQQCTSLTNAVVPPRVSQLEATFEGCNAMAAIGVDPSNASFCSVNGVVLDHALQTVIEYPSGRPGSYAIPPTVTQIGPFAFAAASQLSTVSFPSNLTSIGADGFQNSSLLAITLPASLTNLGLNALESCTRLTNISVDPASTNFASLQGVLFDKSGTTLIQYPSGRIGSYTIPEGVTNLGSLCLSYCQLTQVTIPDSITVIPDDTFDGCGGLTNVSLPGTLTQIGGGAFEQCGLTQVVIPASVTALDSFAFAFCPNLISLYFQGNAPAIDTTVLTGDPQLTVYYLPSRASLGTAYGRCPAVLWNPQATVLSPGQLALSGPANVVVVVEEATALAPANWTPLSTNLLVNGLSQCSDPEGSNAATRFYRLRSP